MRPQCTRNKFKRIHIHGGCDTNNQLRALDKWPARGIKLLHDTGVCLHVSMATHCRWKKALMLGITKQTHSRRDLYLQQLNALTNLLGLCFSAWTPGFNSRQSTSLIPGPQCGTSLRHVLLRVLPLPLTMPLGRDGLPSQAVTARRIS
jgi:hypothetical protein